MANDVRKYLHLRRDVYRQSRDCKSCQIHQEQKGSLEYGISNLENGDLELISNIVVCGGKSVLGLTAGVGTMVIGQGWATLLALRATLETS